MSRCTSTWTGRLALLTGRTGWAVTRLRAWPLLQLPMRWKRPRVEKSTSRLFHPAWKSRSRRGIPTFPPPRRLRLYEQKQKPKNRTFHLLQKADILTCYEHFRGSSIETMAPFDLLDLQHAAPGEEQELRWMVLSS